MTSSTTRLRIGAAVFAGILAVALGLAPSASAHGDRHGDTQGWSHSNPDGGGVDKPYAADGHDARTQGGSDWDGNNGCGNDDDREDDNNGWCGRKPHHERTAVRSASAEKVEEHEAEDVKVLGEHLSSCRRERVAVNRFEKAFCSCGDMTEAQLAAKANLVAAKLALMKALAVNDVTAVEAAKADVAAAKAAFATVMGTTETKAVEAKAADTAEVHAESVTAAAPAELSAASAGTTTAAAVAAPAPAQVLGVSITRGAETAAAPATGATVLGTSASRGTVGALALTGFEMATLALGALVLIAVGLVTRRYGMANR